MIEYTPIKQLIKNNKKMAESAVKTVKISKREIIINAISKLKEENGLSYNRIGEKLNLHKGAVCMILKKRWYPKTPKIEEKILSKIRSLEL